MPDDFTSFVIFAEMRTGSNFLEANLASIAGLTCHGEAFNPYFIGAPGRTDVLGITQPQRDADPMALLAQLRAAPDTLAGFRYFHDHDPRVLEPLLDDASCAKIILTRNPADSYVSWKIAQATDQWRLTDLARRKKTRIRFDAREFEHRLVTQRDFQQRLLKGLQRRGQTAFCIDYGDLSDIDALNGLARWIGVSGRLSELDRRLKRQNPEPLQSKVTNFAEMAAALSRLDPFDLMRAPIAEPSRNPGVPGFMALHHPPLLFMPILGGPEAQIEKWLTALNGASRDALQEGFTQKTLRRWMRAHPGHRRFTVLRHPVARAHAAFCERILTTSPGSFARLRRTLIVHHGLPIPEAGPEDPSYDVKAHRQAFLAFLHFLKANLAQQTGIRIDAHWCSQSAALQGMARIALPDRLIREEDMRIVLPALAREAGAQILPDVPVRRRHAPFDLAEIYDPEIEAAARSVYARDYLMFGFSDWATARNASARPQAALTRSASVRMV